MSIVEEKDEKIVDEKIVEENEENEKAVGGVDAKLSAKMRRIAKGGLCSVQQREVVRLHRLVRAAKKAPGCVHLQRGRELELAVKEPRLPLSSLSRALFGPEGLSCLLYTSPSPRD